MEIQKTSMMKIPMLCAVFVIIYAGSGNFVQGQESETVSRLGESVILPCHLYGNTLGNYNWTKTSANYSTERFERFIRNEIVDGTHVTLTMKIDNVIRKDNGTYVCWATEENRTISNTSDLIVVEKPEVLRFIAKSVMIGKLYVSWEIYTGNDPMMSYSFFYRENGTHAASDFGADLPRGEYSNYVLNSEGKLENGRAYEIGIRATNSISNSDDIYSTVVTPLEQDFVPMPVIDRTTSDSITIVWTGPEADLQDYYNYTVTWTGENNDTSTAHVAQNSTLTIRSLQPKTNYRFEVTTCIIDHANVCGDSSSEVQGTTAATNNADASTSASFHTLVLYIVAIMTLSLCSLKN